MSTVRPTAEKPPLRGTHPRYPSSDGMPMADNDEQFRWIVTLHANLSRLFADNPTVQVSADNLIYPVKNKPKISRAPDVYVAFGVPKEDRACFLVWEEGVFPQAVFEIRSPSNRAFGMAQKLAFYEQYGAEEYYDFDPKKNRLRVYLRRGDKFEEVEVTAEFVSPRLGIRFDLAGRGMAVYHPDGSRFLTPEESDRARKRADRARKRAKRQAAEAAAENERLRALLRQAGIDPDAAGT